MAREPLNTTRVELPVHPDSMEAVHNLLGEFWPTVPDTDEMWRMAFTTAVMEVVGNIIMYCRRNNGGPCHMRAELRAYPDRIEAEVHDNGEHADLPDEPELPASPLAERGRGLAMVRATVDDFRYERSGTDNAWLVSKRR